MAASRPASISTQEMLARMQQGANATPTRAAAGYAPLSVTPTTGVYDPTQIPRMSQASFHQSPINPMAEEQFDISPNSGPSGPPHAGSVYHQTLSRSESRASSQHSQFLADVDPNLADGGFETAARTFSNETAISAGTNLTPSATMFPGGAHFRSRSETGFNEDLNIMQTEDRGLEHGNAADMDGSSSSDSGSSSSADSDSDLEGLTGDAEIVQRVKRKMGLSEEDAHDLRIFSKQQAPQQNITIYGLLLKVSSNQIINLKAWKPDDHPGLVTIIRNTSRGLMLSDSIASYKKGVVPLVQNAIKKSNKDDVPSDWDKHPKKKLIASAISTELTQARARIKSEIESSKAASSESPNRRIDGLVSCLARFCGGLKTTVAHWARIAYIVCGKTSVKITRVR